MDFTANFGLRKPEDSDAYDEQYYDNYNWDLIDEVLGNSVVLVGENSSCTQGIKMLLFDESTRTTNVYRTDGKITSMTLTDPTNGNAVVETITVNRASGQISSLVKSVAGGRTITYTVNRSGGQIVSITKAVN